ncbi:MAG TPA: tRNA glutamyl-Q(34) synthetase GluQRS [Ilumatobacteraceae bacterium]|nr:tRNA glutamyl-Q(34) synthetase GluQRS [Ilumatobacteraceae bacterium]HRB03005.1 tRNA glutamyl-Q(34) synthetase GluQRS [Ilumatobacteraceae bacterium]
MRGRFAPSPTGPLHLGNLRTALVSWLQVQVEGGEWWVRMEDLDRVTASATHAADQLQSLAALGMHPDGTVVRQSERFDLYRDAIATLRAQGRVYECFCTRREIREAAQAPHGDLPGDAYPGTCRTLTPAQRAQLVANGRPPALRLAADGERFVVHDLIAGSVEGVSDDVVLQRNDGVPAYNLAVVVDDAQQGITHVTRGDDLLSSTPRQRLLQDLLQLREPVYAHVPLVLAPDGVRLAKRHGAVTLDDLATRGIGAEQVLSRLAASLGLSAPGEIVSRSDLVHRFRIDALPRDPWSLDAGDL